MAKFKVNNQEVETNKEVNLLQYLRRGLKITSPKDGCSAGACGTCTVLVDGKKTKACLTKLDTLEGKEVITVEGLSEREKDVYGYAFAETGAVQCGFCIPGMIISAKSLLDVTLEPTREDVKKAIMGNICRCTGYVKIEDAILLAAKIFRENSEIPNDDSRGKIGKRLQRVDAKEKALGYGKYTDDVEVEGMVYAKALRSEHPRALVKKINIDKALEHPDVIKIALAKDVPYNKTGHIIPDWDVLIAEGDFTRYVGDALALVATNKEESLEEVLKLIEVEYEVHEAISNPEMALAKDAPKLHPNGNVLSEQKLVRGDARKALDNSKHVVKYHFSVPQTDHAFMEPECAIAQPDNDGILLYTGSQSVYDEQHEVSRMLELPEEKVRSKSMLVGGGFGGKEDMSVQHHAALMAYLIQKPVKVRLTRQESLDVHTKRHAMEMDFEVGCDENGKLTGMKATLISDCGAYASLGGPVLQRACTHAAGPYNYQNVDILGQCVYTNNVPGGAFRGFGVTQSCFPLEMCLNQLAEKVGISAWDIRHLNAIRPGQELPNGQIATPDTAYVECLEAVKDLYESNPLAGIAGSMKNSGVGVGLPDTGRCNIEIKNGKAHLLTSAACIGQGMGTVVVSVVCEVTGLEPEAFVYEQPDTARTPNSGTTTASRQTLFTGEATKRAAQQLKADLESGKTLKDLEGKVYKAEYLGETDPMGSDKPNPVSHIAYGYGVQVAIVNEETKKIDKIVAAYDVGQVINQQACEGQIEGGVIMGLGYAITEDFVYDKSYVKSKYGTLGLLRSTQVPEMEVHMLGKPDYNGNAFGAKGIGEISSVPTAPAVAHAYYRLDGEFRTKLPLDHTGYRK